MITLDTNTIIIDRMEASLAEITNYVDGFQLMIQNGDTSLNWFALDRLRNHVKQARQELEVFKRTFSN